VSQPRLRDRGDYHRWYYRAHRSPLPLTPTESLSQPRPNGRLPQMSRQHYDALQEWKRLGKAKRCQWWDLADQWGYDPGYLRGVVRAGIARYDAERRRELVDVLCAAVDEARANP
jgi:hypothetical protein